MSNQIDVGKLAELLNSKADVDLENTDLALMEKNGDNVAWNGYNVITSNGGTVNNTIYINTENKPILRANPSGKGAELYAFSADNTTYGGGFVMRAVASDGTYKDLKLKSDGGCSWSGSSVVLANGAIPYTGSLFARRNVDDSYIEFFGATSYLKGAYMRADGMNGPNAGSFTIAACDGTNTKHLRGLPDGAFTWAGQHIVRLTAYSHTTTGWYRKYSDGWVEQGGTVARGSTATVTLPVAMSTTPYCINITCYSNTRRYAYITSYTTTSFNFNTADDSSDNNDGNWVWSVCGKHA